MSYVFISYSHKNKEYAHRLENELKKRNLKVWLDDRIDYGSEWPKIIEEKLDACGALILIMSPHSYCSNWVQNELIRAKRKGKRIFPIFLEGNEPWISVEATQYIDVRDGKLPPTTFFDALIKVISSKGTPEPQTTTKKPANGALGETERKVDEIVSALLDLKSNFYSTNLVTRYLEVGKYSVNFMRSLGTHRNFFSASTFLNIPKILAPPELTAWGWTVGSFSTPSCLDFSTFVTKEWAEHDNLRNIAYSLISANGLCSLKPSDIDVIMKDGIPMLW